jgi:hypothetical protein
MYVIVLVLSVLFVLTSGFFPITVYSKTDLFEVKIGWPLAFVVQDQRTYPPPFPSQTHLYSVWENQTQILWLQFFLDIAIVFGAIILGLNLIKAISVKTRRR